MVVSHSTQWALLGEQRVNLPSVGQRTAEWLFNLGATLRGDRPICGLRLGREDVSRVLAGRGMTAHVPRRGRDHVWLRELRSAGSGYPRAATTPRSRQGSSRPAVPRAGRIATGGLPRRAVAAPQLFRLSPRDVVPDTRTLLTAVEAGGGLEQRAVIGGDALGLAEGVDPGLDDENPEPPGPGPGVAGDPPADRRRPGGGRVPPPAAAAGV